jgi:hypothetical protein
MGCDISIYRSRISQIVLGVLKGKCNEDDKMNIDLVLYIVAFVLLLLAAIGQPATKVNLGWLGLALFVLAFIV